jgi:hypothetical protein
MGMIGMMQLKSSTLSCVSQNFCNKTALLHSVTNNFMRENTRAGIQVTRAIEIFERDPNPKISS